MSKLEQIIEAASKNFAFAIVEVVKQASLQELLDLQKGTDVPLVPVIPKDKRTHNYPKCAHPECDKNKWARGDGFCGEHFKLWKSKKIKSAKHYAKLEEAAAE